MPVYEYQCKACHQEFEYQQRMSDPDKTTCEVCGGSLDRLISRTAFQLKGSGWYKDLYSSQKPAAGGGKAESGTGTSSSTDSSASTASAAPSSGASGGTSGGAASSSAGSASSSATASKAT